MMKKLTSVRYRPNASVAVKTIMQLGISAGDNRYIVSGNMTSAPQHGILPFV